MWLLLVENEKNRVPAKTTITKKSQNVKTKKLRKLVIGTTKKQENHNNAEKKFWQSASRQICWRMPKMKVFLIFILGLVYIWTLVWDSDLPRIFGQILFSGHLFDIPHTKWHKRLRSLPIRMFSSQSERSTTLCLGMRRRGKSYLNF